MTAHIDDFLAGMGDLAAQEMSSQIAAVYLFGSYTQPYYQPAESDINLLFLVDDELELHSLWQWFWPVWQQYGEQLRRGPWVLRLSAFHHFVQLDPAFVVQLEETGRLLYGAPPSLGAVPSPDPHEALARQASQALLASAALLPDLLPPEVASARLGDLRRLVRQMWQEPIPEGETAVATYARLRQILDAKMNRLPAARAWYNETTPKKTTLLLSDMQALYKQGSNMVFVLAQFGPARVHETNWTRLFERLVGKCEGVMVTTAVQLSLSLVYDNPLGLVFKSYRHDWGLNPLAALQTSKRQIMRQAALAAAQTAFIHLPGAHFTQDNDALPLIIHDFQNKLLNLRLEYELLNRFAYISQPDMPDPLPDREVPAEQRLAAIYRQFDWWIARYTAEMLQAEA
jgi:hypothetical protein